MKIAVLLGGTSAERDVSISSGVAVARALEQAGHQVIAVDPVDGIATFDFRAVDTSAIVTTKPPDLSARRAELDRNCLQTVTALIAEQIDVVFIALHGGYGENGQIQALLELAGLPFTGSGSESCALAMNKHVSKVLFRQHGIPTPDWFYLDAYLGKDENFDELGFPMVVKPNAQGSTVGLSIVDRQDQIEHAIQLAFRHDNAVILESFIAGRELTVTVLDGKPLPIVEIVPLGGFYDYESKYQKGKTQYFCPADLPDALAQAIQQDAIGAFYALRCRGYARVDYRLNEDGKFFCLEANTAPGMTSTSLVPKSAAAAGIDFPALCTKICELATS